MNDISVMQIANDEPDSRTQAEFDPMRWAQLYPTLSEGQADDRIPMNGTVKDTGGTPSVRRASARRAHQVMFKEWSQARHD